MRAWRWPIILVLAALAVAAVYVDRERDGDEATTEAEPVPALPIAAGAGALTSTWYCAAGSATGTAEGAAEHVVHVVNSSDQTVSAELTVYPSEGTVSATQLSLPPFGRADVRLSDVVQAPWASALVEAHGGDVAVQHEVVGPLGRSLGACASAPSAQWYFPSATTRPGTRLVMALFNPFPSDAVVDLAFETDDGARTPQPYQGLVVPAERVVVLEVGDVVTLRNELAGVVSVRAGRVVADLLQISEGPGDEPSGDEDDDGEDEDDDGDGDGDEEASGTTTTIDPAAPPEGLTGEEEPVIVPPGLALMLGAAAPAETWVFPDGIGAADYDERFVVFNPGTQPAEVELAVVLDDPELNGVAEPFQLTVPPGRYTSIATFSDGRVPVGVAHAAVARATNGVPVVVQRSIYGGESSAQPGFSYLLGSPVVGDRWLVPNAWVPGASASAVIVVNPSPDQPATISVRAIGEGRYETVEGLDGTTLAPAGRVVVDLGDDGLGLPVLAVEVVSDAPVVVESRLGFADDDDLSYLIGIPFAGSVSAPSRVVGDLSDVTVVLDGS